MKTCICVSELIEDTILLSEEEFKFQIIDGALKSLLIKQSYFKCEKDNTIQRIISSSEGAQLVF